MDTQEINIRDIPLYPISSAAKLLNISVHTLRMYEKNGLILPYKKESNHRLYSESDIDRLKCIRKAINQRKISINGIKTLYAMIPCWQVAGCNAEERKNCEAFRNHSEPCWTFKHHENICGKLNCRECDVYKIYDECDKIKNFITNILLGENSSPAKTF